MATFTIPNAPTLTSFAGGVTAVAGQGSIWTIAFGGTWAVGDSFSLELVTASQTYDFGTGRMTGLVPISAVTLYNRVHFVASTFWCGSDNGDATAWEQQAPGAFKIDIANQSQQPELLLSLSSFQGRMALFSRRTAQLWTINADPTLIAQQQVLSNIGIVAANASQSLGDLDVMFPADSGMRSLRVQTINLNAFINDLGGPIDNLIQAAIQGQSTSGITAVVEPVNERYMIYFPSVGLIYVLSYYPSSKIVAWSSYSPALNITIPFVPSIFKVFNSIVYYRGVASAALPNGAKTFIGTYGTPDGSSTYLYDATQPIVEMPWLDLKKPATWKNASQLDWVVKGQWSFYGSMDFNGVNAGGNLQTIQANANPTTGVAASFQTGSVDWSDEGFHVLLKAVGTSTNYPGTKTILSELVFHYHQEDDK